jgi:hypothetical protein
MARAGVHMRDLQPIPGIYRHTYMVVPVSFFICTSWTRLRACMDAAQRCRQEAAKLTKLCTSPTWLHGADHTVQLVSLVLTWLIAYVVSACLCVFRDEKIAYEAMHAYMIHLEQKSYTIRLGSRTRSACVTWREYMAVLKKIVQWFSVCARHIYAYALLLDSWTPCTCWLSARANELKNMSIHSHLFVSPSL